MIKKIIKSSAKKGHVNTAETELLCAGIDAVCRIKKTKGRCLSAEDIALFAETSRTHPRYKAAAEHIADCSHCSRRAKDTFLAMHEMSSRAPVHFMQKAFLRAKKNKTSRADEFFYHVLRLLNVFSSRKNSFAD